MSRGTRNVGARWAMSLALVLFALCGPALAQEHAKKVLCSKGVSPELEQVAAAICDPQARLIRPENLKPAEKFYVRICPLAYTLDDQNKLQASAVLSTKPFAFVTTPESLQGRSLMQLYMDIGYEAEIILSLPSSQEMCAVVFRLPDGVTFSNVEDGALPADWKQHVYKPTWENVFTLFERVAQEAAIEPKGPPTFTPHRSFFRSEAERMFVLSFPREGKDRVKATPYYGLKAIGGSDWVYRRQLEAKLSAMEHFRGDGRTHNEVIAQGDDAAEPVLFEYICPNLDLSAIPELTIVSLGRLGAESK